MLALYGEWLRQAGAEIDEEVAVEIGPLFALDAAEVASKIRRGTRFAKNEFLNDER